MGFIDSGPATPARRRRWWYVAGLITLVGLALVVTLVVRPGSLTRYTAQLPRPSTPAGSVPPTTEAPIPAPAPPSGLPVIDYGPAPRGFPADPDPLSTTRLSEGLHPITRVAAYDAPGGRPKAFVAPTISGVRLTMPIVERRAGWAAVLLPSVNRTIGWLPPGGWETERLRDLIVVVRGTHKLVWLRDDAVVRSWSVTLGTSATPTPLGRTFVLGRSSLPGAVYADTDVFALGSVPDQPDAIPAGLRGAHIGLHTWYHDRALGENDSDGCIRLTRSGQRQLLAELVPGTEVVVVDRFREPAPVA